MLPKDASDDQTNCPPDYYRRNNGILHQIPTQEAITASPDAISPETLATLHSMTQEQLIALINRVSGAMWGIGIKSKEEREDAMLLKLSILALTSDEAKDVVSTSKEYFDRTRGKPAQSIDLNQKIGIVQIVMEAAKLRNGALPSPNLPLALESPPIEN